MKRLSRFRKNNKLTEDDILEKLEQLGLVELVEEPTWLISISGGALGQFTYFYIKII